MQVQIDFCDHEPLDDFVLPLVMDEMWLLFLTSVFGASRWLSDAHAGDYPAEQDLFQIP